MSTLKVGAIQSTTGNNAITVASNGNITTNNIVTPKTTSYVWVYPQGTSGYVSVADNGYLPFNTVYQSAGSGSSDFNTSTYKYTAPVKGLYFVDFFTISSGASDVKSWHLNVDDNVIAQTFWAREARTSTGSVTIQLNANQVMGVQTHGTSYYYRNSNTMPHEDIYTRLIINLIQELV